MNESHKIEIIITLLGLFQHDTFRLHSSILAAQTNWNLKNQKDSFDS